MTLLPPLTWPKVYSRSAKCTINVRHKNEISDFAPIIQNIQINKDKIKDVIGSGGKTIKEICEISDAKVDIDDSGKITVSAIGKENLNKAIEMIKNITIEFFIRLKLIIP